MKHSFFRQDTVALAQKLLGCLLVHRTPEGIAGGMIVETEAYVGAVDKACHAYQNRSERTEIMYHDGGYAYVYLIYGMHHCFNVVTGPAGEGNAVLIRALEPVFGIDLMCRRRNTLNLQNLCSGPGKVCQALGITKKDYGLDLCNKNSPLFLLPFRCFSEEQLAASPRINVDYAEEAAQWPWRFYVKENRYVSKK
ncbi:MAG: DNA-3-methyladenine glycosylase [Acidaminococcaceae bacterium]|nr:DNA-3-methyladenine glycosylase [Acidaminococcaceae bacterium]MBQ9636153.1 DNA-3-methyladenine glycosylase [Acidaminococcaceae bacterium]